MQSIEGVLFEPVGCLAEFPSEPFLELAVHLFGRKKKTSQSGSRSYWYLLNLIHAANQRLDDSQRRLAEALEMQAVDAASAYEDVLPALSELKAMGVHLLIASSLSGVAVTRFLERNRLNQFFSAVWSRDNAGGVKAPPLRSAIGGASLKPERVMFITDTLEGLKVAKSAGVQSILMMNDPDEAKRLALHNPSGGIISLHELPDFIRLVAANA
jgi:phosphoglycolate phosphatase-like HAD superfamily hydrolase